MPFEKDNNHGKGRKKGSKNKNQILDVIREKYPDYNPILAMVDLANNDELVVTSDGIKVLAVDNNLKLQCHKEVAKYCYPTLKAIELTGEDGKDLIPDYSELSKKEKEQLHALLKKSSNG